MYYPDGSLFIDATKQYWPNGQIAINYETYEMFDKNGAVRKDASLNQYDREGNITFASTYDPNSSDTEDISHELLTTLDEDFADASFTAFEDASFSDFEDDSFTVFEEDSQNIE